MTAALALLAVVAGDRSRTSTGIALALFGLGFGMVTQVLVLAVQNSVERRELGVATATTGFFRALGGAVGAAVLGAIFAARAGEATRPDVVAGVEGVFVAAAPIAALGARRRALPRRAAAARPGRAARAAKAPDVAADRIRHTATKEDDMPHRRHELRGAPAQRADRRRLSHDPRRRAGRLGRPAAAPPRLRRDVLRARGRAHVPARRRRSSPRGRATASSRRATATTRSRTSAARPRATS